MDSRKGIEKEKKLDNYLSSIGFLFPRTEKELAIFNEIYLDFEYELSGSEIPIQSIFDEVAQEEKDLNNRRTHDLQNNLYFKRSVLAAEIANQLFSEPTFGHVKFQKLVFLCEQVATMQINERYCKQAAGPYDRKFMHSIDSEFERQKWFKIHKRKVGDYEQFVYEPMECLFKYKSYYLKYFATYDYSIQIIINLFRTEKTRFVELVATLYACWNEIISNKEIFSENLMIDRFYAWSKEKQKFSKNEIQSGLQWMIEKSIYPH